MIEYSEWSDYTPDEELCFQYEVRVVTKKDEYEQNTYTLQRRIKGFDMLNVPNDLYKGGGNHNGVKGLLG